MAVKTRPLTAEAFMALPDTPGVSDELIEGQVIPMSKPGRLHSRLAARLVHLLEQHNADHGDMLGEVHGEAAILTARDPDTVRAPDAAFVSRARLAEVINPHDPDAGPLVAAPELVAEVISPNDRYEDVEAKVQMWLAFGVKVVLLVNPNLRAIHVYRSRSGRETFFEGDMVDLRDEVAGLELAVSTLFLPPS